MTQADEAIAAFRAAIECHHQAPFDLCGEQRAYYLPRLQTLFLFFMKNFPALANRAFTGAVDGYGDPIHAPDEKP